MAELRDLTGLLVVITGGARGIGQATAELFLKRGARVALLDLDLALCEATARTLTDRGGEARAYRADVRELAELGAAADRIEQAQGPIDVWVNNAGIMSLGAFLEQPEAADRRQIEVNLLGVIHGMRVVLPRMVARGRGHVVNVASMAGKLGVPFAATYSATKHAVIGLTEAVRLEHRRSGVDFSYVMPIPVKTELLAGTQPMAWPPPVEPGDVAQAIVHAVQTRRIEVFVPGYQRLLAVLPHLVPRLAVEWIGRLTKFDRFFRHVDPGARAAYVARTTGPEDPKVEGEVKKVRVV
jgi:short-subunit dehydrogenase